MGLSFGLETIMNATPDNARHCPASSGAARRTVLQRKAPFLQSSYCDKLAFKSARIATVPAQLFIRNPAGLPRIENSKEQCAIERRIKHVRAWPLFPDCDALSTSAKHDPIISVRNDEDWWDRPMLHRSLPEVHHAQTKPTICLAVWTPKPSRLWTRRERW